MIKKSILFIFSLIPIFDACSSERIEPNPIHSTLHNIQDAFHFYNWLIEESKSYYDNGWIYELSGSIGSKAGIYYVHGQVLADVSKTYLRKADRSLLPYIVVQAWYYISCLADEGIISELEEAGWQEYDRALQVCIDKKQELINFKTDNSYYFQKGVQTFSLIGSTIAKYYFGYHPEYY